MRSITERLLLGMFDHVLPDDLLLEIGRIASVFGAIEQMMNYALFGEHAHLHRYESVPKLPQNFSDRRKAWYRYCRDHCTKDSISGLDKLNSRLADASNIRNSVMHGNWESCRGDVWQLHGDKEFRATWYDQTDHGATQSHILTDLSGIRQRREKMETLRKDLLNFVRNIRLTPDTMPAEC